MSGNLRDRLRRIQRMQEGRGEPVPPRYDEPKPPVSVTLPGWDSAGYLTLRREIIGGKAMIFPAMPETAGMVMPGLGGGSLYEDLLFFDLETTGLSGGAGTMAFLAAFGRLVLDTARTNKKTYTYNLHITQYLLLDYPGEYDFVTAMLGEFKHNSIIVSYNGKSFDSQILKTRCLMNGIVPPEYRHADLLHPARRLWKTLLPDCCQASIETAILGIDRTGDIPGAMAPEIWFSFLRDGETDALRGICEHNRRDIAGLAAIFHAMIRIAHDPLGAAKKINFDLEALALRWNEMPLLHHAAEMGYPRAELHYAIALRREAEYDESRKWLLKAAAENRPPAIRSAGLRVLAMDSERRLKNIAEALTFAEQGMELLPPDSSRRQEFESRIQRLKKHALP